MQAGGHLWHVVFQKYGYADVEGSFEMLSDSDYCRICAVSLRDECTGGPAAFPALFGGSDIGAWGDGILLYAGICMDVFYNFTTGTSHDICVYGGFFSGAIIPLPFFPEKMQKIMECLPFASMQNVALRIYSGSMTGYQMKKAVLLQVFWLAAVTAAGKILCRLAEKRITVQGG